MHTTGPWEARKGDVLNPDRTWGVVRLLSREACITEVIAEVTCGPTDECDARLMAAAPDLLYALQQAAGRLEMVASDMRGGLLGHNIGLQEYADGLGRCAKRAYDIINNAEGRTA